MLSVVQTAFSIPNAHVKPTKQVKRVNSITLNKENEYVLIRVSVWERKKISTKFIGWLDGSNTKLTGDSIKSQQIER